MENLESKIILVKATEEERINTFGDEYNTPFKTTEDGNFNLLEDITKKDSNDTDGEVIKNIDEIPDILCSNNSIGTKSLYLGVNKNATTESARNVRSGAGTSYSIIGKLYPKECFTFTGAVKTVGSNDWYQIEFLNPSGNWSVGWYQGFNGAGYWKNNPYKSYTTSDHRGNNFYAKAYLTNSQVKVWSPDKQYYLAVPAGEYILCKDGYQGKTDASEHSWMLCHGITEYAKDIDRVFSNGWFSPFSGGTGYVDTGIKSSSRSPKVKGNW